MRGAAARRAIRLLRSRLLLEMAIAADERPRLDDESALTAEALRGLTCAAASPRDADKHAAIASVAADAAAGRGWAHPAPAWARQSASRRGRLGRAHTPFVAAAVRAFEREGEAAALLLVAQEALKCTRGEVVRLIVTVKYRTGVSL